MRFGITLLPIDLTIRGFFIRLLIVVLFLTLLLASLFFKGVKGLAFMGFVIFFPVSLICIFFPELVLKWQKKFAKNIKINNADLFLVKMRIAGVFGILYCLLFLLGALGVLR